MYCVGQSCQNAILAILKYIFKYIAHIYSELTDMLSAYLLVCLIN